MSRYLFVEDSETQRELGRLKLQEKFPSDEFITAPNYFEAVASLRACSPFDGIISDYGYSGLRDAGKDNAFGTGGLDLLAYIRSNYPTTPFAFLSGSNWDVVEKEIAARGLDLQRDHFFDKSLRDEIINVVRFFKAHYGMDSRPDEVPAPGAARPETLKQ